MASSLLTDIACRNAEPGEHWDSRVAGLCLRVSPRGVKAWSLRYRAPGSAAYRRLALGRFPEVGLAAARQRGEAKRVEVSGGSDPQGARRAAREVDGLRFDDLADAYIKRYAMMHKKSWRQDQLLLRIHVRPSWGKRRAASIEKKDASELLDAIAAKSPTSANRTHSVGSKLFNWAIDSGLLPPEAKSPFDRMKKRGKELPKERVLAPGEIRALWTALDREGSSIHGALRLLALVGLRPGEVAGLAVAEVFDIEDATKARLEIAGARMKSGKAHVVPLAPMALAIVRKQVAIAGAKKSDYLFAAAFAGVGAVARHSLSQAVRRLLPALPEIKEPFTPHDLRRTTATQLAALGVPREDRLAILAHAQDDVHARHYDKHDRLGSKRAALELWELALARIVAAPAPLPAVLLTLVDKPAR